MLLRKELADLKRLVVKVGSNVVTREDGGFDTRRMRLLVEDICELKAKGVQVLLVSSGAVNIGKAYLSQKLFKEGRIEAQQAASSIGQPKLMQRYCSLFEECQSLCSQVLLTHEDFKSRQRYLNAKRTIEVLLANNITPILNENDTVSFREITVGDNDQLAAQAAVLVQAQALLLITSADGLYDRNPALEGATLIPNVAFGQSLSGIDTSGKSQAGRGGMKSKLEAVKRATGFGIKTIIASKDGQRLILDPLSRDDLGTYFQPKELTRPGRRKLWLASLKTEAAIEVDRGAYEALRLKKSLLPKGVVGVKGEFSVGDCVNLMCEGEIFGQGIVFFSHREVDLIKGRHSSEIESIVGPGRDPEVVHTENLALEMDWT